MRSGWYNEGGWTQDKPQRLSVQSVMNYAAPLYCILKNCFPDHPKMQEKDGEKPAWYKNARKTLEAGDKKEKIRGEDEEFDPKTAPIYFVNQPLLHRYSGRKKMSYIDNADLLHVAKNLIGNARLHGCNNYVHRAQIMTSAYAISRGGEVKWMRFSFWVYDPRFAVIDISWCELKTANWYSMPMVNRFDPDLFEIDWLHCMACAMAVDKRILQRPDNENKDYVWMDLHQIEDTTAVGQFSKILQRNLPVDMPAKERARITTRSWRKGPCTLLSHHRDVSVVNATARSGHKMGGNQFETYVDSCGIGLSLPSAMALNDFPEIFAMPKPPSFEVLSNSEYPGHLVIVKLIQQFLPSNLDDFQPNRRLFPVLEQLTATVVMT